MDGKIVNGLQGKLWLCKKDEGHVLGIIVRTSIEDRCFDRLLLFREAREKIVAIRDDEPPMVYFQADISTMGYAEGTHHDIPCSLCNAKRTWWIGQGAAEQFVASRKKRVKSTE